MALLNRIQSPADVKSLDAGQLPQLAEEIRQRLIETTSKNGGHIGPNLGVVELTVALHRAFNTPKDRFVFDVAHQGYVHKLLTGRNDERFDRIRQSGGLSGFLTRDESEHDCFGAGHAGTALSAALGMATARDLAGGDEHVVAVCGDAAFTCGITMEAMNNIATTTRRLIVILNDNEWSIAKNVGALSRYFNELITNPMYQRMHHDVERVLSKVPGGESLRRFGSKAKQETKDFLVSSSLFEKYKLRYIGPFDGHDFKQLEHYLEFAKKSDEPVLLHVITKKGKGYDVAIKQPEKFHGSSPYNISTGEGKPQAAGTPPAYQDVMGQALVRFGKADKKVLGITAAMPSGTGLKCMSDALPEQFFDVGIAEEHAVLFAAGLATKGFHPVCAIYSTFLQRAYDQIIHDVCLQKLPVLFCMDRAGLSPNDGPTHHGLFDIAYLRCVPNAVVMAPANEDELVDMMHTGLQHKGPAFIRYPRGTAVGVPIKETPAALPLGKALKIREGSDIVIWSIGTMLEDAIALADRLQREDDLSVGVVNARFVKPLDLDLLQQTAAGAKLLVTMEDHVIDGGFGTAVLEGLNALQLQVPVKRIAWPDQFVGHGSSVNDLRAPLGLDADGIISQVREAFSACAAQCGTLA
jgi:1-deoxy-D-xylulose-5-phosphate synthase